MTRAQILDAAKACVTRDRNDVYGDPEYSFAHVVLVWDALDLARGHRPRVALDAALYLAALKLVRASANPSHVDSFVDLAGYAACAGELGTPLDRVEREETDGPG